MSKELFVTNFISGKAEGSQKMRWWLRHSSFCSLYVQKWRSKRKPDGVSEKEQIRNLIKKNSVDWNNLVYRSQQYHYMTEHAELELALVDAALGPDEEGARSSVVTISDFLFENVEKQISHHKFMNSELPVGTWKDLLYGHVRLFTESIRWYITPDNLRYLGCEERRTQNTLALAAFSTEWL